MKLVKLTSQDGVDEVLIVAADDYKPNDLIEWVEDNCEGDFEGEIYIEGDMPIADHFIDQSRPFIG